MFGSIMYPNQTFFRTEMYDRPAKVGEVHKRTVLALRTSMKIMVDGYFIRSLLMAFFFKLFPEIILDGRLFIAEPPLYRVKDSKNPFVINMADYISRYASLASKDYILGYQKGTDDPVYMDKKTWVEFLTKTANYVEEMEMLVDHYKINSILLEMILSEFAFMDIPMDEFVTKPDPFIPKMLKSLDVHKMLNNITAVFPEIYYDDDRNLLKGTIDARFQSIEITHAFVRRCRECIKTISEWGTRDNETLILKDIKTKSEHQLTLLGVLKILKKYQPDIVHRFKGLTKTRSSIVNCGEFLL